jgi:hypothetical protein
MPQQDTSERNYEWFKENLPVLMKEYKGKFVIVYEQSIRGAFPSFNAALDNALTFAAPGDFLVQHCTSEEESAEVFCSLIKMPQFV